MSNDKLGATFGGDPDPAQIDHWASGGALPQREPMATFAQHGTPPPVNPGRNAEVAPGRPPWDSQIHQDLAVQHGWPTPGRRSSTVAVWALVAGCVGILAGWCMFGLPCIAAVILGHVGLSQTRDDRMSGRGMAVAGLVLGYVALIPAIVLAFWFVLGSAGAAVHPIPTPSPSF